MDGWTDGWMESTLAISRRELPRSLAARSAFFLASRPFDVATACLFGSALCGWTGE